MFKTLLFSATPTTVMTAIGLLILRLGLGASMFFAHGIGKAMSFSETSSQFPDPLGVGNVVSMLLVIFAEVICSVLIVLGLMTRLAAIPLFITMAVAFLIIHGMDPFKVRELSLIFGFGFATLIFTGPGFLSFDSLISKR